MKNKLCYSIVVVAIALMGFTRTIIKTPIELNNISSLKSISDSTGQEKVHLHLDKPYCAAGDNIWFKAYVLDEHLMEPSKISKVLYVDLLHKNNIVKTLKLHLENGVTWGDFKLSDSIPEGTYRIRAYTQLMRNESEVYFFHKSIAIDNRTRVGQKETEKVIPISANQSDVKFFPEGGRIVKGLPTKVAVRAVDVYGNGEAIEGTVNSNGESVNFVTNEMGLGYFMLNTDAPNLQKASITFKNGIRKEYDLPESRESGYSMMLKASGSLQIYMSADLLNKEMLSLVGQRNGNVYFRRPIPTAKQAVSVVIPYDKLPSGILQLSLLDKDGTPLCERFAFINHKHDQLELDVEGLKEHYAKRSSVELKIDAKQFGSPVVGSFSISVTNSSVVIPDLTDETNILTSFLLNADANNAIVRPNHYLQEGAMQDMDLLMLTGAWRSILWNKLHEIKKVQRAFNPERTLTISGTLTNNGKPVPNGKVTLVKSIRGFDMLSTTSNAQGKFRFDSLMFQDSTKLLIQARTAGDKKNVKILVDQIPNQEITLRSNAIRDSATTDRLGHYIRQSEAYYNDQQKRLPKDGATQLKEVLIKGERATRDNNFVRRHGRADQEFTSKELDSAAFLSTVLFGKIRGNYRDYDLIQDGILLTDIEKKYFFTAIEPSSLERIEVLSSPHLKATYHSTNPLMIITTKRYPTFNNVKYAPGVTTITLQGFSDSQLFQSPDYELNNDSRPDLRPTVYWNPNLVTDESGKLKIKYFNTDIPGKYRIVIEGVGGNRGLARKEIYYEVK